MRDEIEISVFIKDDATKKEIVAIEEAIKDNINIASYEYISKDDAKSLGENVFKDMPEMMEAIQGLDNPFPSSFNIQLVEASLAQETAEAFMYMDGVEENGVEYGKKYMKKILAVSNGLKITSYIALIFFFIVAVFFMVSIVNAILVTKQEENKIKFMIGASPLQIKVPFYIEGAILGLTSSILAAFICCTVYNNINNSLNGLIVNLEAIQSKIIMLMIGIGFVTGLLATRIALHSFNKLNKKNI